jgi:hypothetical protein
MLQIAVKPLRGRPVVHPEHALYFLSKEKKYRCVDQIMKKRLRIASPPREQSGVKP